MMEAGGRAREGQGRDGRGHRSRKHGERVRTREMQVKSVLVMGDGLAGLCAAWRLAELGFRVMLVGNAGMGEAPRSGEWVPGAGPFGLVLPSCQNFLDLLGQLGTLSCLEWVSWEILLPGKDGGGSQSYRAFRASPGGLARMLLPRGGPGSWAGWIRSVEVILAALGLNPEGEGAARYRLRGERPSGAEPPFLHPLAAALLLSYPFLPSPRAAANLLRMLLGGGEEPVAGMATCQPRELWEVPLREELEKEGVLLLPRTGAIRLELEGDRLRRAILGNGEVVEADAFVSSLPPRGLAAILPREALRLVPFHVLERIPLGRLLLLRLSTGREAGVGNASAVPGIVTAERPRPIFALLAGRGSRSELLAAYHPEGSAPHLQEPGMESPGRDRPGECPVLPGELLPGQPGMDDFSLEVTPDTWEGISLLPGVPGMLPGTRTSLRNLYLCGDWVRSPFLSLPLEGSVWTANRCVELMALDLLGKGLPVNRVNEPPRPRSFTSPTGRNPGHRFPGP